MTSSSDIHVLVVDDNEAGRYVKAHTLTRQGYRVSEAGYAEAAIAAIAVSPPDLVLLDVRLPDGNGVELCRRIKAGYPQVAVLQTSSALISAQDRALSLEAGADSYLVEPIEPDELVAVVRALLRMRAAEQQLREVNENLTAKVVESTGELAESNRLLETEQAGRREAEALLWHAQKLEAIGRLTGGLAHDFNNLLTVITGNLELLQLFMSGDRRPSPERQRPLIEAALRAAEHGAQMTQQLLAFARRGVLQARTVDLGTVIAGTADFLRRTLGDAITLEFGAAPALKHCHLDPVQFEAAILNLAINARDAMPEGGRLRIEFDNAPTRRAAAGGEAGAGHVRIRVKDTGIGMDAEVVERAFEPFFTTKGVGEGSGLGLSQVYGFVSQSGGEVKITSAPGKGTTVTLLLPATDAPLDEAEEPTAADQIERRGEETILVVEDEEQVRSMAVEMIEDLGYRVVAASDGVEALDVLKRGHTPIDLLFSDVLMPGGINGVALAAQARKLRGDLKVLLTSGYPAADADDGARSRFPLIQKPYRRDKLAAMLRSALDNRRIA